MSLQGVAAWARRRPRTSGADTPETGATHHPEFGNTERRKALSINVYAARNLGNLRTCGALRGALSVNCLTFVPLIR